MAKIVRHERPGRPKAIIDWNMVGKMLEAGCTAEGIAATIGIDRDTLYIRCRTDHNQDFSAFAQEKRAKGDELLRQKQMQVAMRGDKTMLIWLGKQRLGQSEQVAQEITHNLQSSAEAEHKMTAFRDICSQVAYLESIKQKRQVSIAEAAQGYLDSPLGQEASEEMRNAIIAEYKLNPSTVEDRMKELPN